MEEIVGGAVRGADQRHPRLRPLMICQRDGMALLRRNRGAWKRL